MPVIHIKGKLSKEVYNNFLKLKEQYGSGIEVIRNLLSNKISLDMELKEEMKDNFEKIESEIEVIKNNLERIREQINYLISFLTYRTK